jgi:hypothetical protein
MMTSGSSNSKIEDKERYKCYFNEPGERKPTGQTMMTSTNVSGSSMGQPQKVTSLKKQSPATKYENNVKDSIKDDKKLKVKVMQKKIG